MKPWHDRAMRTVFVTCLLAAAVVGCGRSRARASDAAVAATPDAAPAAALALDAAPERGGPDDPLAEKLRHCPLTVDGARTTIADVDVGIALTVTADAAPATAEIRRRAAHLVAFTTDQAARKDHGGGDGGGFMRNCPVVVRDTRVDATDVAGGSRLVVRPTGALTVADLRTETRRRHDALVSP